VTADFDLSELSDLTSDLIKAAPKAAAVSSLSLTKIAAEMKAGAVADVAVKSGETRDSIRIEGGKDFRRLIADSRAAFFLEFGTSNTAPQPFIWPQAPLGHRRLTMALQGIDPFD